jgi:DNA helicase IV
LEKKPNNIKPNRILAIAFQAKAKDEIEKRLLQLSNPDRFNVNEVNVRTFHKLGKDICERHLDQKIPHTRIVNDNEANTKIKEIYENKLNTDSTFYSLFLNYMKFHNTPSINNRNTALREKELNLYLAINNTRVNSIAEKVIMDFLLTHKINGEKIEVQYEPNLDLFKPDFYLKGFELYIEHWGLSKNGKTPPWFSQSSEKYKEIKEKKKKWFLENKKMLVETFTYEYNEAKTQEFLTILQNRIIQKLQEKQKTTFLFTPLNYEEIVEVAWAPYKDPNPRNITEFIKNAKTYDLTPNRINEKLKSGKWDLKQTTFGLMALEVYRDYEKWLKENNKLDFGDMINKAIEALLQDSHLYYDVFDHILIDEYQDISAQRHKLIKTLLERNPKCKLFCVGDDWQSIMGFAGSNLNYFVNFKEYFTNPVVTKISTNYRSQKVIVDAGAALIKNNGQHQISKMTVSKKPNCKRIKVICSNHSKKYWKNYYEQTSEDCAAQILKCIQDGVMPNDILVLSRYKFPRIINCFAEKAGELGISVSYGGKHPRKNQIRLMNVHRCKGLQAKVVFILNVIKDPYGFPCEIEDSSILEPARENYPRQDQNQEERRLFYVALTRAMEELTIYTWEPARSQFLREIAPFTSEETLNYWDWKRGEINQVIQHQSTLINNSV